MEHEDEVNYQKSNERPWNERFSSAEDYINQEPDSVKAVEKNSWKVLCLEGKYFPDQIRNISKEGESINVMTSAGQQ